MRVALRGGLSVARARAVRAAADTTAVVPRVALPPRAGAFDIYEVRKSRRRRWGAYVAIGLAAAFASFEYKFAECVKEIGNPYEVGSLHTLFWLRVAFGRTRSRLWGSLMESRVPVGLRAPLYSALGWCVGADLEEARYPLDAYPSVGELFARTLVDGARPLADADAASLTCPCDCTVLKYGDIEGTRIEQIKGVTYFLPGFLGTDIRKRPQTGPASKWRYCVLYLAPKSYHHFHAPCDMTVQQGRHFPGELLPVNPILLRLMPDLFAVNERVVLTGSWKMGAMYYCPIGAYNVGKIVLDFDKKLRTNNYRSVPAYHSGDTSTKTYLRPKTFTRGERLGGFRMGSTVVLVFESGTDDAFRWEVEEGAEIRLGEMLATHNGKGPAA